MSFYKIPVHRSLLHRELIAGIPQAGLGIIFLFGLIFIYVLHWFFMIIPLVLLYFVMRHLTKQDQWLIDILLENRKQKDKLIP